jgi:predicted amidohydrolase
MDCRLVVVQTNPKLGDLAANLQEHLARADELAGSADLVLFPELSLTGYFVKDLVEEVALKPDDALLAPLLERSRRTSIAFGFAERARDGRIYNALAFLEDGRVLGVHRKVHLVNYGLFDESRDFAPGEGFRTIESKHGRFGPLVCEDAWHTPSAYSHFLDDADALLVAAASPARGVEAGKEGLGSTRSWHLILRSAALLYRVWVGFASRVGWEDGIGFSGGSAVFDPLAELRAEVHGLEPGLAGTTLDSATLRRARAELPLRRDEKPWILAAGLARHVPLLDAVRKEHARHDA